MPSLVSRARGTRSSNVLCDISLFVPAAVYQRIGLPAVGALAVTWSANRPIHRRSEVLPCRTPVSTHQNDDSARSAPVPPTWPVAGTAEFAQMDGAWRAGCLSWM